MYCSERFTDQKDLIAGVEHEDGYDYNRSYIHGGFRPRWQLADTQARPRGLLCELHDLSSSSSGSSARRRALESERARLQQQLESERAKLKAVVQEIVDQERADSSVGNSGPGNMLGSTTKEGGSTTKVGGSRQMVANMSMVELSSRVKKRTGKAWGGHWSKRHGPLLHFVQTHCLTGEVRASCKSGVRLLAQ